MAKKSKKSTKRAGAMAKSSAKKIKRALAGAKAKVRTSAGRSKPASAAPRSDMRALEAARRATKSAVDREREKRIAQYERKMIARGGTDSRAHRVGVAASAVAQRRILAEGDSWFDFPWYLRTGGGVINHLEDLLDEPILNLAEAGDEVREMMSVKQRRRLERKLPGFNVLLFSGGGNDLVGDQMCLWIKPNQGQPVAGALDQARFANALQIVEIAYRELIDLRDRLSSNCWIVTHGYDFPDASGDGICGIGPWLKPSLDYRGWTNSNDQYEIVKMMMQRFEQLLLKLDQEQSQAGRRFVYVRTQGTLTRGEDWNDEIHPNREGFRKIASKFAPVVRGLAFP